ncbi:MAG: peptidoglycan-associated lipoprotein Pal [Gemmatimonadota bacterium]
MRDTAAERLAREEEERRRREAAAAQLCRDAEAAMAAGNYERARTLYMQAKNEYPGTTCANGADAQLAKIDAIRTIQERIHFEFDRSRITDEAAAVLQRKAEVLKGYSSLMLTLEGHCDERGSLEYNQALGQRRAESAKRYLVSLGLSESMFRTVSFGEERPIAQGSNEAAWAQNRRAEFVIQNVGAL